MTDETAEGEETEGEETDEDAEDEETEETEARVAESDINLRAEADGMSEIIAVIPAGGEYTVLSSAGDWTRVEYEGLVGYIFRGGSETQEEKTYTEKQVTIFTNRRSVMRDGETVTLTSLLEGFEDCKEIRYQWQCDRGAGFEAISGANGASYSYTVSAETLSYSWRLRVYFR